MNQALTVKGKRMNVGISGSGGKTLVLISGSGVPIPTLEYALLAESLATCFQAIVPEKFGYGLSDLTDETRSADTAVDEYRTVLQQLDIGYPVILAAHSMGFIEALRWAQRYPGEISAIVGLDPAAPEHYRHFDIEAGMNAMAAMAQNKQMCEEFVTANLNQLRQEFNFSPEEEALYRGALEKNVGNSAWISEGATLRDSIALVEQGGEVQLPTLFFVSNGEGTTMTCELWRADAQHYLNKIKASEYKNYDYAHHLFYHHKDVADDLARTLQDFVARQIG